MPSLKCSLIAATLAGTSMFATPALAQSQCDSRDKILATLAKKYSEAPVAVGLTSKGGLVEVLSTGDGNTLRYPFATGLRKYLSVAMLNAWTLRFSGSSGSYST